MNVNVLISCMHQDNTDIIQRTNIQTDVIVINQCDKNETIEFDFLNKKKDICHAKFICTTERGLSRSRNMAIENAWGDICLICDDDELLEDDYEDKIINAYQLHPREHIIVFTIDRRELKVSKTYPSNAKYVNLRQILQTSSVQVTFKRDAIISRGIKFDVMLGSGTGNGGGEENKFLIDCKKGGYKIYYVPICIGAVLSGNSTWFNGYTTQFMRNQGWSSRRAFGPFLGLAYIVVYGYRHRELFENNMSVFCAYKNLFKGYFEKRD